METSMSDNRLIPAAVAGGLVGLGLAVAGGLIGSGIVDARTGDRTVTVRGLAERDAKADLAVLPLRFTQSGDDLAQVQAAIDADAARVRGFLAAQGFRPQEIDLGRLEVVDNNAREYGPQTVRARFILAQTVLVRSTEVDRVAATTRALSELVRQGVVLQDFRGPSYLFTKLNDVRPAMIKEATASARTGAEQFARDSGASLAGISKATQGSFEIQPRDPLNDGQGADGSIVKKLRVVTTVTYALK
jgi:hypothetical protein